MVAAASPASAAVDAAPPATPAPAEGAFVAVDLSADDSQPSSDAPLRGCFPGTLRLPIRLLLLFFNVPLAAAFIWLFVANLFLVVPLRPFGRLLPATLARARSIAQRPYLLLFYSVHLPCLAKGICHGIDFATLGSRPANLSDLVLVLKGGNSRKKRDLLGAQRRRERKLAEAGVSHRWVPFFTPTAEHRRLLRAHISHVCDWPGAAIVVALMDAVVTRLCCAEAIEFRAKDGALLAYGMLHVHGGYAVGTVYASCEHTLGLWRVDCGCAAAQAASSRPVADPPRTRRNVNIYESLKKLLQMPHVRLFDCGPSMEEAKRLMGLHPISLGRQLRVGCQ
jgi:hypothetical protein